MLMQILGWIIPTLIPIFFKDLEVRKNKLAQFEAWQKRSSNKGSEIADSVQATKEIEQALKDKRPKDEG